jgi:hypothetical protein
MKIVFWNCNGKFRAKGDIIIKEHADLYIISEVEPIDKISWLNNIPNKVYLKNSIDKRGLLVFSFSKDLIEPLNWLNPRIKYIQPFKFQQQLILGIWMKKNYIEDLYVYSYLNLHKMHDAILIGDFNSNVIWNREHNDRSHTDFNDLMSKINHFSAYHRQNNIAFGAEKQATFFMYRKIDRPYYIDYAYLPEQTNFKISFGEMNYLDYSDHLPIILTI